MSLLSQIRRYCVHWFESVRIQKSATWFAWEPKLHWAHNTVAAMPLYYFHLINDHPIEDDEGVDLADDRAALHYGHEVAREMGQHKNVRDLQYQFIRIMNDKGALIGTANLADARSRSRQFAGGHQPG